MLILLVQKDRVKLLTFLTSDWLFWLQQSVYIVNDFFFPQKIILFVLKEMVDNSEMEAGDF